MNRSLLIALLLIVLCILILLKNTSGVSVDLLIVQFRAAKALVFLGFIAVGVCIGVLLK